MTAAAAPGEHTVVCSVAFVDIVEYTRKPVEEQMRLKARLDDLLAQALADVPAAERIILDTGEGAAISFLRGPDDCLFFALALRDALAGSDDGPRVRVGLNLGPVRLVKDAGDQPNIIGDGMSVGHRIMGFADPDQILASRPYHEAVAALSADYARMFDFVGVRTDKHVREHEVYALGGAPAPARLPRRASVMGRSARPGAAASPLAVAWAGVVRRPALATALAVVLILTFSVVLRYALHPPEAEPVIEPVAEVPPSVPAPPPPPAKMLPEATVTPEQPPAPAARSAPAPAPPPAHAPIPAVVNGSVRFVVVPWGEVYVDGEKRGVAPPLRDISLKPGRYRIEIRNPGFQSYVQVVDVGADQQIRIRHRFE